LSKFDETYEITLPTLSCHNLIIGTPYVDLSGKSVIKNLKREGDECTF
jgi:hypothetical protein